MRTKIFLAVIGAAGIGALSSGCSNPTLRVVGDRPADVYVTRGSTFDVVKHHVGWKEQFRYAGRTSATSKHAGAGQYALNYQFKDEPEHMVQVRVQSADGTWDFEAYPEDEDVVTIYYPPIGATKGARPLAPAAAQPPAASGPPRPGEPQPAGMPQPNEGRR